jgi:hypothetical protein
MAQSASPTHEEAPMTQYSPERSMTEESLWTVADVSTYLKASRS